MKKKKVRGKYFLGRVDFDPILHSARHQSGEFNLSKKYDEPT